VKELKGTRFAACFNRLRKAREKKEKVSLTTSPDGLLFNIQAGLG
jgi:hypothetical protein